MNKYIKIFMDDNDLKVGDEFRKKGTDAYGIWHFNEDGCLINKDMCLINENEDISNKVLVKFLLGEYEVERIEKRPWKPEIGDRFWFIDDYRILNDIICYAGEYSKYLLAHKLVFRTEKEAEDYKWFLDKVDEYQKPFILGIYNYFIYYNHEKKEVSKDYFFRDQAQGTIYFGDKENIEKFLEEVGEDRIKKYWFNIWE